MEEPDGDDEMAQEAPAQDEGEPVSWEVKQVLDKRMNDVTGGLEYLIEWKNWDGPPTWEPEENCECTALIKRFEKERAKGGKRDSHPPSRSQSRTPARKFKSAQHHQDSPVPGPSKTPTGNKSRPAVSSDRRRSARVRESSERRVIDEITIDDDEDEDDDTQDDDTDHSDSDSDESHQSRQDTPVKKGFPRAKTPDHCCKSPCSGTQPPLTPLEYETEMRKRKLVLKDIIGAVNSKEILLIVKWHGTASLEKVPLQVLRRFHCQDILDFLLEKIKWKQ